MTEPVANVPGSPAASEVNKFHNNSDSDTAITALHHTLGIKHNQASPGDHKHDGKSSQRIGTGKNLAFPTTAAGAYSQPQMQALIDALRLLGWGT